MLSYFANTPYKLLVNRYLYICSSQIHFFSRRETNLRGTNRSLISFKYRILCSSRKRTRIGLQCLSSQVEEIFHTPLRAGISITIDQFQHSLRHRSHRISSFSERKYFDISLFWSTRSIWRSIDSTSFKWTQNDPLRFLRDAQFITVINWFTWSTWTAIETPWVQIQS